MSRRDLPGPPQPGHTPRLISIGHFEGIAAVAPGQQLTFGARGLTIVYGPTGAGKTSYDRVIKRLCRAVSPTRLLPNVFAARDEDEPRQTAKVELEVGGKLSGSQVDLRGAAPAELATISVFDSDCADVYVLGENTVAYVPSALTLLTRMAATQDQMREELERRIEEIERSRPAFPELVEPSAARDLVLSLSHETVIGAVDVAANVEGKDEERRNELAGVLALAGSRTAKENAAAARQTADEAEALRTNLATIRRTSSEDKVAELDRLREARRQADTAVRLAAEQFATEPISGIGGEPWQRLWRAAHEFWHAETGTSFPPEEGGAVCPLCLRALDDESRRRLQRFEEYVTSTAEEDSRLAHERLEAALKALDPEHVAACRGPFLDSLKEADPDLHERVAQALRSAESRLLSLRARARAGDVKIDPIGPDVGDELHDFATRRREQAETLLKAADPTEEVELRAEFNELEGRLRLRQRRDEIVSFVAALGTAEIMRTAHHALHTRKITEKQKELSNELITEALRAQLREELDSLDFEHIKVELNPRGARGETRMRLRLQDAVDTCALDEVLSIGERRAVALAFFLAEVAVAEHDGGIVLDDPVSSLDDERRSHLARRLCQEALRRQVIVFTHDIQFMLELIAEADELGVARAERGIWRIGDTVGRVDAQAPFETLPIKDRMAELTKRVEHWPKPDEFGSFDKAWQAICDFYLDLRKSWERAIEEILFHKVIERFSREVQTLRLREVEVRPEHVARIEAGMTRCSKFQHDSPPPSAPKLPRRDALAADLAVLRDFVKEIERERKQARRNTKKSTNGHQRGSVEATDTGAR